jgi:hypothetical protein
MNLLSKLMTWATGKHSQREQVVSKGIYAWAVIEGPISASDMCGCGEDDCDFLDDPTHMIVVRCSVEGSWEMFDEEFFLDDFNAAYSLKNEIQLCAGPMLIGEVAE